MTNDARARVETLARMIELFGTDKDGSKQHCFQSRWIAADDLRALLAQPEAAPSRPMSDEVKALVEALKFLRNQADFRAAKAGDGPFERGLAEGSKTLGDYARAALATPTAGEA